MKLENEQILIDAIKDADLVLIGIGEEWGVSFEEMLKDVDFSKDFSKFETEEQRNSLVPILQREYLKEIHDPQLKAAYANLLELVKDKNYFLLSMNQDRYPALSGFNEERMVFPCGGYTRLQCDIGCTDELHDSAICDEIYQKIHEDMDIEGLAMPVCEKCGKELVFNNVKAVKYLEAGYLPTWERYMKWLQGTVNKKLCLVELGVSMRFPSVIRWPFEKTTFYNQKAKFFRIHHSLSQAAENIGDRCYTYDENSVAYMAKLFVS